MRSKRDPNQIEQFEHDEASNAKRVKIADTELNMELDHNDGDSVTSHPHKLQASAMGVDSNDDGTDVIPPLDCSSLRLIRVDVVGSGSIQIKVSPSDTEDVWYTLGNPAELHEVCARRIKVKSVNLLGDVHLVGRS